MICILFSPEILGYEWNPGFHVSNTAMKTGPMVGDIMGYDKRMFWLLQPPTSLTVQCNPVLPEINTEQSMHQLNALIGISFKHLR
ncbi:hypothetical protein Y1Q_0006588 [Alligator mississippiensis]|uniref:Uncharacterized protein n=1 Tax=Alligator mississippiensis TaxID=8496 RepID=A0A151NUG0_ALLMI|nr:hypothetical protein Y1Q_0006588 [Alligator mississippiensis]